MRCVALFPDAITTRFIQTTDDGMQSVSLSSSSAAISGGHLDGIAESANTAAPMTVQSEPYQPVEIKYEKDHKNRSFQVSWYQRSVVT